MAYNVEQTINGTTYVYRATGYWDKDKQQARQKRVCIGKRDPATGKIILSKSQIRPRDSRDYGNYFLLNTIAEDTGLARCLQENFPDTWHKILTCAFYEVSERKPLYLCEQWSESTKTPYDSVLSSQRISELLHDLGKNDHEQMNFFKSWATHRAESEYLAFDITSISSYSTLIDFVEYGYNRDGENLPQINIAMLFGETSLLPIFYRTIQGSIRDMSTLSNMLLYTQHLEMKKVRFVMDKGFFSNANVREMLKKPMKFAIAVPFTTALAKRLSDTYRKTICEPQKSFILNGDIVYAEKHMMQLHGEHVRAFVFYDERQYLDAKEGLLRRIMRLEQTLSEKKRLPRGFTDPCLKYLTVRHSKNGMHLHRNEDAIHAALHYKGSVVILTNDMRDAYETLSVYRAKDAVERAFDNMKNELDMKRLRVHSELAMTGRTFLCFIALILHSWLDKRMKDADLYKRYTQEEVIAVMKRLKIVEFSDGKKLLTEISKNQMQLFKSLQVPAPESALL
jgi:transposase